MGLLENVNVSSFLLLLIVVAFIVLILGVAVVHFTTTSHPDCRQYESEKSFKDPAGGVSAVPFPSIWDRGTVNLSVIVPAYEEEKRLPPMLDECIEFLEKRRSRDNSLSYEVILVDDGSRDKTSAIGLQYSKKYGTNRVRVLTLAKNRGKGGAITWGMMKSRGRYLLFADADGATKFSDLTKLEASLENIAGGDPEGCKALVAGSRAHLEQDSIASRSTFRTILMYGFHFLVWLFCVRTVRDTQCGFKLLTRDAARILFSNLHVHRWAFDVELLYMAESLKIPVAEVAVQWTEIEGSKLVPVWSWLQMGKDLVLLWLRYRTGAWNINIKRKVR